MKVVCIHNVIEGGALVRRAQEAGMLERQPYCGPMYMRRRGVFRPEADVAGSLFGGGRRVWLTHRGSTAIQQACRALKAGPGDKILAPAYNCGSEIDAMLWSGAEVILYGVDRTAAFDLGEIESLMGPDVRAVFVTHFWGFPQPLEALRELCTERGVALVEDCAHALFSAGASGPVGLGGDLAVFSLRKLLPLPDGGALVINGEKYHLDADLSAPSEVVMAKRLMLMNPRGVTWPVIKRLREMAQGGEREQDGTPDDANGRPPLQAWAFFKKSLADRSMSSLSKRLFGELDTNEVVRRRRRNYSELLELVGRIEGVKPLYADLPERVCPLMLPVLVADRRHVDSELARRGIEVSGWWAYHPGLPWERFPDACFLKDSTLCLPVHQCLDEGAPERIAEALAAAMSSRRGHI